MKHFKILGSGCRNCVNTAEQIERKAKALGVDIELEKVTDMAEIMGYGVMSTPGVVIDDKLVHAGGMPSAQNIEDWLTS